MPSISQMDYIYIDVVNGFDPSQFTKEEKRKIANAIDNGCGNEIVFVFEGYKSRVIFSGIADDGRTYYVAYWDWDNDVMTHFQFSIE